MYIEVNDHKTFFSNGNGTLLPNQPSVVFIHGAAMDHTVWTLPVRYFARHNYNVYAFDLPGHGRSEGPPLSSIESISDWLESAMEILEITSAAIVGHSMGSLVSICFSAKYPERSRCLALLGTSTPMPVTEQLLSAAKANQHDAIDMTNTWSHSDFGLIGGNSDPGRCITMSGQRLLERSKNDVLFTDLNACNSFEGGESYLARISQPTLIISGGKDKMTSPLKAREAAEQIRGSRLIELDRTGHFMMTEQPNAVLDALATII